MIGKCQQRAFIRQPGPGIAQVPDGAFTCLPSCWLAGGVPAGRVRTTGP